MTPLQFEAANTPVWQALEAALDRLEGKPAQRRELAAAEVAALYRRSCEHLALARARAYPIHLVQRLDALTERAHQAIYRRQDFGLARLRRILNVEFPRAVRRHRGYMLVAALVFGLTTLLAGWAAWRDPGFALTMFDAQHVRDFEEMYDESGKHALGRMRDAETDWTMFGFYVMNNVGVAFRCFAGGLLAGVGSLFFLAFNGATGGAIAGYLTARGHGTSFYSFVVTHGAFELTAIVISGAAGLRLGHALLAPGRRTRGQALLQAARESAMLLYGMAAMLVIAAALEAFWSSAGWVAPEVKFGAGAAAWMLVIVYLVWQGRGAE